MNKNKKNNEGLNKKILEDKLKEIGTNINEVKAWLNSTEIGRAHV